MPDLPPATIPATEVRTILSSVVGQEYLISVALPFNYDKHPEKTYPVIYVSDGNLYFGLVTDMVRIMNMRVSICNELPDAIIVGIGYPPNGSLADSYAQWMHLRMRDFSPVADESGEKFIQENFPVQNPSASGGAGRFLQFIQQELVPMIESEYRVDAADRTFLGHSWGGDFALYTLFNQPHLFQRYVVVSPDFSFKHEHKYIEQLDNLPVRLYLAAGEAELSSDQRSGFETFIRVLESWGFADFSIIHEILPKCTHCAVVAPAYQAGLVAVFP